MQILLGNKRLSVQENWQPTLEVFTKTLLAHKIYVDTEKEYERLYGRINKKVRKVKSKPKAVRKKPTKKNRGNSKS